MFNVNYVEYVVGTIACKHLVSHFLHDIIIKFYLEQKHIVSPLLIEAVKAGKIKT